MRCEKGEVIGGRFVSNVLRFAILFGIRGGFVLRPNSDARYVFDGQSTNGAAGLNGCVFEVCISYLSVYTSIRCGYD